MKKRKNAPAPKEKPFSPAPFSELKSLRVEAPPAEAPRPEPAPPKRPEASDESIFLREMQGVKRLQPGGKGNVAAKAGAPAQRPEEQDDLALFLREMGDVRRLESAGKKPPPAKREEPHPLVRKLEEEESRLFIEALKGIDVRFLDEFPNDGESLQPVSTSRMKRLKKGEIRIDLELDLHGLTRDEALESLSAFIASAWRRGQQAVLVITGKGLNSPGEPVLQGAVAAWLREAGKQTVAEFSPAPGRMGGSGAYVVFLKEHPVD